MLDKNKIAFAITWQYTDCSGYGIVERVFYKEDDAQWVFKLLKELDSFKNYMLHEVEMK